jgi:hypothetical protein
LIFAAYTGLRPGELYALRHEDLGVETFEGPARDGFADAFADAAEERSGADGRLPVKAREAVESVPRLADVELCFPDRAACSCGRGCGERTAALSDPPPDDLGAARSEGSGRRW